MAYIKNNKLYIITLFVQLLIVINSCSPKYSEKYLNSMNSFIGYDCNTNLNFVIDTVYIKSDGLTICRPVFKNDTE